MAVTGRSTATLKVPDTDGPRHQGRHYVGHVLHVVPLWWLRVALKTLGNTTCRTVGSRPPRVRVKPVVFSSNRPPGHSLSPSRFLSSPCSLSSARSLSLTRSLSPSRSLRHHRLRILSAIFSDTPSYLSSLAASPSPSSAVPLPPTSWPSPHIVFKDSRISVSSATHPSVQATGGGLCLIALLVPLLLYSCEHWKHCCSEIFQPPQHLFCDWVKYSVTFYCGEHLLFSNL